MNTQNKKLSPEQLKELESFKKWLEDNKYSPKDEKEVADLYKKYKAQKTKKAAHGAKLNYFRSLKNQCPEGEELYYYKKGGSVGCGCKKKKDGGVVNKGPITKGNPSWKTNFENRKKKQEDPNANTTWDQKLGKRRKMTPEEIAKAAKNRADARQGKGEGTPERKCGGKVKKNEDGSKINKNCGGSAIGRFKMHRKGGSLNGIPFYLGGTPKGGAKWKTSPRPDYIYNGKPVYPPTKYSPEIGNAEKHYLIDPYSGTLLDSGESNFMNDLEDTRHPMGGYDASYELAKDWDTNSEKYRKNPILVSGFVSDLIGNRGFGRRIGTSWGNAYPHNPGWIKNPLFKKGYYYRY